jgi:UDP-N-acetyl-D-galactosamine dehydrogenase
MTLAKVLVMGVTFKENVSDVRNSKVADIVQLLKSYQVNVDVIDPFADSDEVEEEYGFKLVSKPRQEYNVIILAVSHEEYMNITEEDFKKLGNSNTLIYDVKGIYRNKIKSLPYMSL